MLLLTRGLVGSREEGQRRILAGEVLVKDRSVTKAGALVEPDAPIRLRGRDLPYVSRGGLKLERALEKFAIKTSDRIVLDVGASTGGLRIVSLPKGYVRSMP